MDIEHSIQWLQARGCTVETEALTEGSRCWLVFDPASPLYQEDGGLPDHFTDAELVRLVEQLQAVEADAATA